MTRPLCPRDLFTRAQIAQITGIDDSTLNYWMRENILRPTEGGDGKGSHRRFDYREVTLAAVLLELRGFGIGASSLASIADQFHEALDWMTIRAISHANRWNIWDLCEIQLQLVRHGCVSIYLSGRDDEEWFADYETQRQGLITFVNVDWDQAYAYKFRPRPNGGPERLPTPDEVALVRSWTTEADHHKYRKMDVLWAVLDEIQFAEPKDSEGDGTLFFRRENDGGWNISERRRDNEAEHPVSFIGVDIPLLSYRLWQPWAEASGSALAVRSRSWGNQS